MKPCQVYSLETYMTIAKASTVPRDQSNVWCSRFVQSRAYDEGPVLPRRQNNIIKHKVTLNCSQDNCSEPHHCVIVELESWFVSCFAFSIT